MRKVEDLIVGGGMCGLAAANSSSRDWCLIEGSGELGGLVKTQRLADGSWHDHVLHLLHLSDAQADLSNWLRTLLGDSLVRRAPRAAVHLDSYEVAYPIQFNVASLRDPERERALAGLLERPAVRRQDADYETFLMETFGEGLCDIFYFPYNRKQWKRELADLVPGPMEWNIQAPPDSQNAEAPRPYNSNGWYVLPPVESDVRGMAHLARTLGDRLDPGRVKLRTELVGVDLDRHIATVADRLNGATSEIRYERMLTSIPLPQLLSRSKTRRRAFAVPDTIDWNTVCTVMVGGAGYRRVRPPLWKYFPQADLIFNRLYYMTEFDMHAVQPGRWSVTAEVTAPHGVLQPDMVVHIGHQVVNDLHRAGEIEGCMKVDIVETLVVSPAYVVFSRGVAEWASSLTDYLGKFDVASRGRYGAWRYSSMSHSLNEGRSWSAEA